MAKKRAAKKMSATKMVERATVAIRLDLSPADRERLERVARTKGLNMASYARMAVLARIKADEREADE